MRGLDLPDIVKRTADRHGMDLARPLALVSGGPDSVALLRVLVELGGEPVVLHLDHGLRGEESRRDAEFVDGLCRTIGLACEQRRLDLGGSNIQEEAREARYRVSEEIADARGLSTIVTGHTADDVAETVLLNLARGSGLRGLTGIPPVRGRFARPLIESRRAGVLAYLEALDQPYRIDPTNLTGKYARNRVRLEVLPVLEEIYPGAGANIARTADLLRSDLAALEQLAGDALHRRGEEIVVYLDALGEMPPALQRHAVRGAYDMLAPGAPPLESKLVHAVLDLARRREGTRTLDLPGGIVAAVRSGTEVAFYEAREPEAGERELRPGENLFGGWRLLVDEVAAFDAKDAARPEVAYLNAAEGPYRVRMAREGDSIHPLGLGGTKKVSRAMMDRKVPGDLRKRTPVVVDWRGRVAWIAFGELDEEHAAPLDAGRVLRLEAEIVS